MKVEYYRTRTLTPLSIRKKIDLKTAQQYKSSKQTTNMAAIVSATDFTPANDMIYTKVKVNSVGGKSIALLIQTPSVL